jgi:hypothetical protein
MYLKNLRTMLLFMSFAVIPNLHASITVDCNDTVRTLDSAFIGVNFVAFWDNIAGDVGSRNALQRAGVKLIRFPGGEPADFYDWQTWSLYSPVSPLMAGQYAKAMGARLVFQTNATGGGKGINTSGAHVADWVKSCDSNKVDVALWEIGNEPEIDITWNASGYADTALNWYFNKFNEQAPAIHAAHPGSRVAGPVGTNVFYWRDKNSLQYFVKACSTSADAVSLHWYVGGNGAWGTIKGCAQSWPGYYTFIRSKTQKPFYITEWYAAGDVMNTTTNTNTVTGLVQADVIGAFSKSVGMAGECMFGTIHGLTQGWGILGGTNDVLDVDEPGPQYFSLVLWSKMGPVVLNAVNSNNATTTLSVWANKKKTGEVQVMAINKTNKAINETVSFTNYDPTNKAVDIYEYKTDIPDSSTLGYSYNGAASLTPATKDLPPPTSAACGANAFSHSFPPFSATVLEFTNRAAAVENGLNRAHRGEISIRPAHTAGGVGIIIDRGDRIQKSDITVKMFDLSGHQVAAITKPGYINGTFVWNTEVSAKSTYVVRVTSGEAEFSRVVSPVR